jgi:hypothetical protein
MDAVIPFNPDRVGFGHAGSYNSGDFISGHLESTP